MDDSDAKNVAKLAAFAAVAGVAGALLLRSKAKAAAAPKTPGYMSVLNEPLFDARPFAERHPEANQLDDETRRLAELDEQVSRQELGYKVLEKCMDSFGRMRLNSWR